MGINISRGTPLLKEALDYRAMRQDMIASNIANVNTPGYRPRDVDFETMLAKKSAKVFNDDSSKLQMAQTSEKHLAPKPSAMSSEAMMFYRDGHMAKNDGNSVDLDVETTEMAKNSQMYSAIVAAMKKSGKIYMSVLEASAKV